MNIAGKVNNRTVLYKRKKRKTPPKRQPVVIDPGVDMNHYINGGAGEGKLNQHYQPPWQIQNVFQQIPPR
jgi:hypothetical protein